MKALSRYNILLMMAEITANDALHWSELYNTAAECLNAAAKEKLLAHIDRTNKKANRYQAEADEMLNTLEGLEGAEEELARLLKFRYLEGLTWDEVAEEMYYSPRQIYRMRKKALEAVDWKL